MVTKKTCPDCGYTWYTRKWFTFNDDIPQYFVKCGRKGKNDGCGWWGPYGELDNVYKEDI